MDIAWFVVLSAFIFAIGAAGVLTRRSPLVILLCLELMLNAGNLALIAFSRMLGNDDGQVFALIVMVVAACEVVVGLGIIVAMYRRRLPIDVDEMSELRGMSATDLRLARAAVPAGGHARCSRSAGKRLARARRGLDRQRARSASRSCRRSGCSSRSSTAREELALAGRHARSPTSTTAGFSADLAILVDPLSVVMCLVVSGVSFLIHLYSVAYMDSDRGYARFFAYLNFFVFSMLLLVLAANFVLLIVGWAFVGAASYLLISLLVPPRHRDRRRHQGVRDQRDRRHRPGDRRVPAVRRRPARSTTRACSTARRRRFGRNDGPARGRLPDAARRRVREVGPAAAAHLAARRDGGPDAGLRADPRGDDGHRRRLPDRAHATRCSSSRRPPPTSARSSARATLVVRRDGRAGGDRPQARDRLLDDVADRLHGPRRLGVRATAPGCST